MSTIGEALVAGLRARGVDVVFGIPGVHTIELYRGLPGSGIRHVTARHEAGAGFMADGYARVSGKPGVALVITGPGVTNILTPMAQARADSVPMLVISGVNATATLGRGLGFSHELPDQRATVASIALSSVRIESADQLAPCLDQAFSLMTTARGGPVHIEVPTDVMRLECPAQPAPQAPAGRPAPDPAQMVQAARRLGAARRPVILIGGGARSTHAALRALAERLDAPVVQTANARGMLHGHPLCVPASPSLDAVRALLHGSDVVLAVGAEFGHTEYDMYSRGNLPLPANLIRIDIDADQLARRPAELKIRADAGSALTALLALVPDSAGAAGAARAAATRQAARAELSPKMQQTLALLETLRRCLPGAILVGDSPQAVYAGNLYYDHDRPGGWFNSGIGFGTLGYGPGAAIGAAIAAPGAPVVCLIGDGGLQFSLAELLTAVDERLNIVFLVWNNHGYGEIAESMRGAGMPVLGCDPTPPLLEPLAQSFRMPFQSIAADCAALAGALAVAPHRVGPRLIEIRVD